MTNFNSGRLPQPGGAAIIKTPQGVADVAVAGDITEIQEVAVEEAAEVTKPKRRTRRSVPAEVPAEVTVDVAIVDEDAEVTESDDE